MKRQSQIYITFASIGEDDGGSNWIGKSIYSLKYSWPSLSAGFIITVLTIRTCDLSKKFVIRGFLHFQSPKRPKKRVITHYSRFWYSKDILETWRPRIPGVACSKNEFIIEKTWFFAKTMLRNCQKKAKNLPKKCY